MKKFLFIFSLILLINFGVSISERIGCKDEDGNLVDWFYLYKLPNKFANDLNPDSSSSEYLNGQNSGLEYLYMTNFSSNSWTRSARLINSTSSLPGRTLDFIYSKNIENFLVAMYNDEPTNGNVDNSRGHTKGLS
jgi:deoxyribonuclease-2